MQANKGRKSALTGSNPLKGGLSKLWHLSDSFDWMSPLPYPHRRGVILAALLLLGAFFWPGSSPDDQTNNSLATPVDISGSTAQNQPQTPPSTPDAPEPISAPVQAEPVTTQPQQNAQTQPPPVPSEPQQQPAEPTIVQTPAPADGGQWKEFTIQRGHTLTQLFRDNHYTVTDAFLLARVEGQGRPLNELRVGQKIKVQVTDDRQVTALEVELTPNRSALFVRQRDGSFKRER